MTGTVAGRFSCVECDRRFTWRHALAGRKVKCPCGAVMICPADPCNEGDALFAVAPIAQPAPIAIPMASPAPLVYRAPKEDPGIVDTYFPNRTMDLHAPLALIGGSVVIQLAATYLYARWWIPVPLHLAMARIGAEMIVGTIIMLIGVLVAAKFRGISFGPFWTALLKLAAISLSPNAAMMLLIMPLAFVPLGGLIIWGVGFSLYFALLGAFFDLDQEDTWYCVIVIFIVDIAATNLIPWGKLFAEL
jgi:hypothetical protein